MNKPSLKYKYIYGPVSSWRLGNSLGIDPISRKEKICTFDCVYCQIGKTDRFSGKREIFVPTGNIIREIKSLPALKIDYFTFSGRGEPTLAKNLGEIIKAIKKIRPEKAAIITDGSLIYKSDVRKDLSLADLVTVKLDAHTDSLLREINKPTAGVTVSRILEGIKEFKANYKGKLALQIMFIEENKAFAKELAAITKEIGPSEVQINTPLRPSAARPLPKKEIDVIKKYFKGMNFTSVYDAKNLKVRPLSESDTLKRRGEKIS